MPPAMPPLTADFLRSHLRYDPETGHFFRRHDHVMPKGGSREKAGDLAGGPMKGGYIRIGILGTGYLAHRLAWLYMTGHWPEYEIDHIDGIPGNNAWANLRDVDHQSNLENRRHPNVNNILGVAGIESVGRRFHASLTVNGKKRHLGSFHTLEEATAVRSAAKTLLHLGSTIWK